MFIVRKNLRPPIEVERLLWYPGLTKLIGVLSKQHGAWRKALEIYHCVPSLGLKPDTALTNAAISACDRGGQWREALKLWFAMDQRDNISYRCGPSRTLAERQPPASHAHATGSDRALPPFPAQHVAELRAAWSRLDADA